MPAASIICHCRVCGGNRTLPIEEALDHAARRDGGKYTYEVLAAMLATVQDRGDRISTTSLSSKCLRQMVLERHHPYTIDPDKLYASFRGTMFHGQLEQHFHPQAIAEPRFHKFLTDLGPFSGSPDLVDPKAGTLYDYKFTKEVPRWDKPWDDHNVQCQVNRWLVDHADYVEWEGMYYVLNDAAVAELTSAGVLPECIAADSLSNRAKFRPIEWQGLYVVYFDDKGTKPLLISRSEQVAKKTGPGTKSARVADIWPDERVEELVRERYVIAQQALAGALPDIPQGWEGWSHVLCGYCSVRDICVEQYVETEVQVRLTRRSAA